MSQTSNSKCRLLLGTFMFALSISAIAPFIMAEPARAEKAVAPEKNPPGDIPDTQVFVDYASPAGFTIKVPEGWARSALADGVSFIDKLDGVVITTGVAQNPPTLANVKANYISDMAKIRRALKAESVTSVKLPSGPAVRIVYSANSEPNAVTNKQVRLEGNRYLLYKSGKLVALDFYAPLGADNIDQWQLMSESFTWK